MPQNIDKKSYKNWKILRIWTGRNYLHWNQTYYFGLKVNLCPPIDASYMKPAFDKVAIATPAL